MRSRKDADPGIAVVEIANKKPAVVSKRGLMMGIIGGGSLQPAKENHNYFATLCITLSLKRLAFLKSWLNLIKSNKNEDEWTQSLAVDTQMSFFYYYLVKRSCAYHA